MPTLAQVDADRAPWMSQASHAEPTPARRDAMQDRERTPGRVEALLRRHASLVHEIE
jgi:hypothetical protein